MSKRKSDKRDTNDIHLDGAEALGLYLAKLRKAAGLNQEDVSIRMGYTSERNLSDYEGGHRVIKVWELVNFCEQCGVEPETVLAQMLQKRPHGLQYKPAERVQKKKFKKLERPDYIQAFETLVRQDPDSIPELKMLLKQPHRFTSAEYYDLLHNLNKRPEVFSLENLRDAYSRLRADMISIVFHVAKGDAILDQDDRIGRAADILRKRLFEEPERETAKPANGGPPLSVVSERSGIPREERVRIFNRLVRYLHFNVLLSQENLATRYFSSEGIKPDHVSAALGSDIVALVNRTVIQLK